MPTRRPPAQQRRPAIAWLLAGALLLGSAGLAHAATALEQWRSEVARVHLLAQNDVPRAYEEAQRLQASLPAEAAPADKVRALNLLARIETYLTLTDAAAASAEQALDLAQRLDDRVGQAEANLAIAVNAVNQGRLDAVNKAATQAMTLLDGANRPELLAEAMLRTAMMYRRSGQFDESVTLSMQTLDIARRSGNALALTYGHQGLAISYDQSDRVDEARQHYALMRDQARAAGSKMLEGSALLGLGGEYSKLGDARQAESMLRESIAIQRTVGAPTWLTSALYALAEHWRREKRYAEAQELFDEIIAIHERSRNRLGLWWGLVGRGANHESLGHLAAARTDAERAYALAKEIGQAFYLNESAKRLAILVASDGDYRNAYRYSREAVEITTRDAREKAAGRMVELAQRYQAESKQQQINELTRLEQRRSLEQRWLWTVLIASMALLAATTYFLLRQRRTHHLQQQLNEQLQRSRNKLQATLDAIPDLLFELGLDGRYHDYHSPRTDLLAAPAADLIGRTVAEVLPPEAAATCIAALHEADANGTSSGRQINLDLAHGSCWFELSVARKTTATGQEARFIVLSRDITERKRFEAQEDIRLRIFELLVQGGELDSILASVVHYVEAERPELLCSIMLLDADGQRLRSTIGPRLPAGYLAAIDGTAIGEGVGSCGTAAWRGATVVVEDIDSHPYWAPYKHLAAAAGLRACWSEPIIGCSGTVLGTFAIYLRQPGGPAAEDQEQVRQASHLAAIAIERIRMAAALTASEREFRTLAENMPDNVVRYDNQGRRTYLNSTMAETLGIATKAALGKAPSEFPPEMRDTLREYVEKLRQVLATGEPAMIEMTIGKGPRQGEIHNVNIVAERDEQARIVGALAISCNITELKHKEREIAESRDLLRELAARRDSAREEERKRIAREIHDELGQMLTAQRLDIATLQFQFGKESPMLANRCQQLINVTDQTIQVVRNIATTLRPASLDMGITSALEWLATEFRRRNLKYMPLLRVGEAWNGWPPSSAAATGSFAACS